MQPSIPLALLTIAAIVIGPIVALWIQRKIDEEREQLNRKRVIFKELMATRAARLSPRHVDALNAVGVEFSEGADDDSKPVMDAWRLYLDHLNTGGTLRNDQIDRWTERGLELLIAMLHEMSKALQYNFDQVALRNIYAPIAHSQHEMNERRLLQHLGEITAGTRPIWITGDQPQQPPT